MLLDRLDILCFWIVNYFLRLAETLTELMALIQKVEHVSLLLKAFLMGRCHR